MVAGCFRRCARFFDFVAHGLRGYIRPKGGGVRAAQRHMERTGLAMAREGHDHSTIGDIHDVGPIGEYALHIIRRAEPQKNFHDFPFDGCRERIEKSAAMSASHNRMEVASDSVASSIEKQLRCMESAGHGAFNTAFKSDGMHVSFGRVSVVAENYDIALVRMV
jgi:hypothetical protein